MNTSQVHEAADWTVVHLKVVVDSSQSLQPVEELHVPAAAELGLPTNSRQVRPTARATLVKVNISGLHEAGITYPCWHRLESAGRRIIDFDQRSRKIIMPEAARIQGTGRVI